MNNGGDNMRLIIKLVLGIIIDIGVGLIVPEFIIMTIVTFKSIFGEFLEFTIPLIIIFFIVREIAGFGIHSLKMIGLTSVIAYSFTILAGVLAFIAAFIFIPMFTGGGGHAEEAAGFELFFVMTIDPLTGVMTALVAAFVFGIGITRTNSPTL